jgi:hypothetical protein
MRPSYLWDEWEWPWRKAGEWLRLHKYREHFSFARMAARSYEEPKKHHVARPVAAATLAAASSKQDGVVRLISSARMFDTKIEGKVCRLLCVFYLEITLVLDLMWQI